MTVAHENEVEAKVINNPAAKNAAMRALVGPSQGWSDYVMRVVELDLEGFSPKHVHPWPHINYFLEGRGVLEIDGRVHPVGPGSFAFVPAGSEHQYRNEGQAMLRFICIVPKEGHR